MGRAYQNNSYICPYRQHNSLKQRHYEQHVREIECGSFTPLVFSATGGMALAATIAYKRLASLLVDKRKQDYSKTISWLRCSISFSLVRSAVMCLGGAHSSFHQPVRQAYCEVPLDVAIRKGRVPSQSTLNFLFFMWHSYFSLLAFVGLYFLYKIIQHC